MIDHEESVLAGVLPDRLDRLRIAQIHLSAEFHFRDEQNRNLWVLIERFYDSAGGVLTKPALGDLMRRAKTEVGKILLYEEMYDALSGKEVEDAEFRYSIDALKDIRAEQKTGEAITASMEILQRGLEVGDQTYVGHADARGFLYEQLAEIDRLGAMEYAPEGDTRSELKEMIQDYLDRKTARKRGEGVMSGIPQIDRTTAGFQPGELILVVGYTATGKSQMCAQIAWNAMRDGRNVFFATSETVRPMVRRRLLARHSLLPQFGGQGIDSHDIKHGTLSPADEIVLRKVALDYTSNPSYGKLYVAQIPRGGTLSMLEGRLNRQQAAWNIDVVIVDYLALLRAEKRRSNDREELGGIIRDCKVLAATFDHGRGVPIISPWAVSQTRWHDAQEHGGYKLASLADTSEAEKSPDVIISMLRMEFQARPRDVLVQFLKNRDGDIPAQFELAVDFRYSFLGQKESQADIVRDLYVPVAAT